MFRNVSNARDTSILVCVERNFVLWNFDCVWVDVERVCFSVKMMIGIFVRIYFNYFFHFSN